MKLLDDMLEAWRYTREGVIAELANIPADRFADGPAGLPRSPLDIANHIIESGRLMAGELSLPGGDFKRKPYQEIIAEHSREGDLVSGADDAIEVLTRAHRDGDAMLRAAGAELLMTEIRQFSGVRATRMSWLHHGIAHEEYHRGQIALYARLLGITPALTRQIQGG
jgi:uncharacterized damage-inducible protein DinB